MNQSAQQPPSDDDFVKQLPTSYQFKLQPVDLAKLRTIRKEKNEEKRRRLFEKMGIPITSTRVRPKKILLSKQRRTCRNIIDETTATAGNDQNSCPKD